MLSSLFHQCALITHDGARDFSASRIYNHLPFLPILVIWLKVIGGVMYVARISILRLGHKLDNGTTLTLYLKNQLLRAI